MVDFLREESINRDRKAEETAREKQRSVNWERSGNDHGSQPFILRKPDQSIKWKPHHIYQACK